ncbi:MAG TPA: allantoinase AllB, partial [Tepidisphaeraceae bacterium]|nr:allantoinase AllB [Tepidisphaeraceae bacterium]
IDGGEIVGFERAPARQEIDGRGLLAMPGAIDTHVHFNEPGRAEWEGFASGSAALVAGGGTCCFDMPLNSSPPVLDPASFDLKRIAAEQSSVADFGLWGGITPGNLDQLEALAERGVVGFKAFMSDSGISDFERSDDDTLHRGMSIVASLGLPVAVHAEDQSLTARRTAEARAAGRSSVRDYLDSRPIDAEVIAINRAAEIARATRCDLHIVHVSSAPGVQAVLAARAAGTQITCETCPHYLFLDDTDVIRLGAIAKCAPPIRPRGEVDALWREMLSDHINLVASDHSPAPASMKQSSDFFDVWGGIAGVQCTLSLLLSDDRLTPQTIASLTATRPADRYGISGKGRLAIGYDADIVLVDPEASWTLQRDDLYDRHRASPYAGRAFRGRVMATFVRGRRVFDGTHVDSAHRGRLVRPNR